MRRSAPPVPSAAELARQADTCVACRRHGQPVKLRRVPDAGDIPLCVDYADCNNHSRKVGIYCVA